MATETLVFMPNGDVTLTLIRYVLKEEDVPTSSDLSKVPPIDQTAIDEDGLLESASAIEAEEESDLFFAPDPPDNPNGPTSPPPPRARRGSNASSRRDRSESPPASFWATLKRQAARASIEEQPATPPPAKKPERIVLSSHQVQCVVSSRHMMLASRHFQTILTGNFNEAITLRTQGHVTIPLQDDLDTMVILLNIIHGAGRKVPRQVNLEVLSKLAVLVSKFEMLETVEFFSDTWIDSLQRGGLPKSYNGNVLPLVFVFWVFDRPAEFKAMTRLAQRESTEKLEEDLEDIPILHSIIDAIKRDREFAIETAITIIHAMIDRYMAGQAICDSALDEELRYACDAMVLGCLMTSSRKIGIWPKPDTPFNGRKFNDLVKAIRSIRILDVCNKTSSRRWNSHGPSPNSHGLEDSIEASMKSIEAGLDGLKLSDYPKLSEGYSTIFQTTLPTPAEEMKKQAEQDTRDHFQVYLQEEKVQLPTADVKVPQQGLPLPSSRFSPRIDSPKEQTIEEEKRVPQHEFSFSSPRIDASKGQTPREEVTLSQQELSAPSLHLSTRIDSSKVQVPMEKVKVTQQQFSDHSSSVSPRIDSSNVQASQTQGRASPREFSAPSSRPSPRIDSVKVVESPKQQVQAILAATNPFRGSLKEGVSMGSREVEEPAQEGVKVGPRHYSQEFQQSRVQVSPKPITQNFEQPAKEQVKTSPRQYSQEFQQSRVPISPKPIAQGIQLPGKEEVKATPRNSPSPVPSQKSGIFAKIADDRPKEEVKRAPSVVSNMSIDEILKEVSQSSKEVKPSTVEIKETPNGSQTTTEAEDMWTPPKNFKMKKAKKTFSTRY